MVGDFGWEHEGTECQVDTVNLTVVNCELLGWSLQFTQFTWFLEKHNAFISNWELQILAIFYKEFTICQLWTVNLSQNWVKYTECCSLQFTCIVSGIWFLCRCNITNFAFDMIFFQWIYLMSHTMKLYWTISSSVGQDLKFRILGECICSNKFYRRLPKMRHNKGKEISSNKFHERLPKVRYKGEYMFQWILRKVTKSETHYR